MERSKILVVDDEKLVRRMIARVLESEGMSIVEASNGLDAVQMAKAQPFDLIILDIIMEGIDGFQVIHQLRSEGMLTPVFILSGRQCSATSFLRNWDSILEKKRANLRSISEPARLRQPPPQKHGSGTRKRAGSKHTGGATNSRPSRAFCPLVG